MYCLVLAIFLAGFAADLPHHPFALRPGAARRSARTSRAPSRSATDADRYKLVAFVLSAALAGLAGATKAIVFQLASLTDVHWTMSGEVVLMTLLGGLGTRLRAGRRRGRHRHDAELPRRASAPGCTVIQGVIFVICVLAFRRGVIGELGRWLKKSL